MAFSIKVNSFIKFNHLGKSTSTYRRFASSGGSEKINQTCLYEFHKRRQARMEPFAGYSMAIVYKDQTIKSEHMQTREMASVFDVSHMMQLTVRGKDRHRFLEQLTVADIESMGNNKCTLSMFTNQSGGIIDDCIIAKRQDHLHVVSNAGNAHTVWTWLESQKTNKMDVHLERLTRRGLIALQGPKAAQVLQELVEIDLRDLEFMNTTNASVNGVGSCIVTRCGYTGEDGFEISVDPSSAETLMESLCQHDLVKPAGLGARDTLRLEAGLCLHGHDITDKTTPVEAALAWAIHKRRRNEGGFLGADVILEQLKQGTISRRTGLVATKGGPPAREGCQIYELGGNAAIGSVTSGTFAPKHGANIAMAYLPTPISKSIGQKVSCEVRGKKFEYEVVKMPFVKANYYFKSK